jgi:hypothetical protein
MVPAKGPEEIEKEKKELLEKRQKMLMQLAQEDDAGMDWDAAPSDAPVPEQSAPQTEAANEQEAEAIAASTAPAEPAPAEPAPVPAETALFNEPVTIAMPSEHVADVTVTEADFNQPSDVLPEAQAE